MLQRASSDSEAGPPTLVKIALDLQILICTLLHPSDILALRRTCKTLQRPTRQRVVWVAALRRVCLDNSLFLPSFPILDMSNAELEHAAMAPFWWIKLCAAFEKRHSNDSNATLLPKTTRIIEDSFAADDHPHLFIVPGGRYVLSYSYNGFFVWDLGYTSSADCKLIASVELEREVWDFSWMVQATPDGMGLIIFFSCQCSVYEIYPETETPQLTAIAHLDVGPTENRTSHLLPDRVLWDMFYRDYHDKIVFRVWDYRANHSTSFSTDIDLEKFRYNIEVLATKTAIILLCAEEILIWAIPPLSPQPPDFFDRNPTHIPPLFRIAFPDGIVSHDELVAWKTMSSWYSGSSRPLYFDIFCQNSKLHRFEITVKPDLFDTSLHLITTELVPLNFTDISFLPYSICEDALVATWQNYTSQFGVYTGLTSSRFTTVISHGGPAARLLFPWTGSEHNLVLCPTSGRYVQFNSDIRRIVVVDLF